MIISRLCGLARTGQMLQMNSKYVQFFKSHHSLTLKGSIPLIDLKLTSVNQYRHFISHREINPRVEETLKKLDSIPKEYNIIYRAPLIRYLKATYATSFASIMGLPVLFMVSFITQGDIQFPVKLLGYEVINNSYEFAGFVLGLVLITTQIGVTVFKYPLRIYNAPEKNHYFAIYQDFFPWKNKKEEFIAGEMEKCDTGIMPWKDSLYKFRKRKAVLLENHFRRPSDFESMFKVTEEE